MSARMTRDQRGHRRKPTGRTYRGLELVEFAPSMSGEMISRYSSITRNAW